MILNDRLSQMLLVIVGDIAAFNDLLVADLILSQYTGCDLLESGR